MTRWRVDAEGQRARRCSTFKTAVAAAMKLATPDIAWITVCDTEAWTAFQINLDWAAGQYVIDGKFSWTECDKVSEAIAPIVAAYHAEAVQ